MKVLTILGRFLLNVLVGVLIFLVIAGAALVVWKFTDWMRAIGAPVEIWAVCHALADLLFFVDVICFVIFVITEAVRLIHDIVRGWRL